MKFILFPLLVDFFVNQLEPVSWFTVVGIFVEYDIGCGPDTV